MKKYKIAIVMTIIIFLLSNFTLITWGEEMHTNEMLDEFIIKTNNIDLEVQNARYSTLKEKSYDILRHRLDAIDLDIKGLLSEIIQLKAYIDSLEKITKINNLNNQVGLVQTFHASKFISKLKNGEKATIVFLGDSTTEQNATTNGNLNHVGLLENWLKDTYGEELVTVVNAGISGNSIKQMWQRVWKDVLVHKPDLIIISSALNDQGGGNAITLAEYKSNYDMIIKEILAQTECDIILRTPNLTQTPSTNIALEDFNEVTYAIAEKHNLGVFDLFTEMQKDIDSGNIVLSELMQDNVHPNEFGHEYMFEKFKSFFTPTKFVQKPTYNYRMLSAKDGIRRLNTNATLVAGPNWMNGNVLAFNNPGTSLEFEFVGSEFSIVFVGAASTGQYKVFIDGIEQPIVDTYRAVVNLRLFDTYKVEAGKHVVQIQGLSIKNANSTSTNLQIQGVIFKKAIFPNMEVIPVGGY